MKRKLHIALLAAIGLAVYQTNAQVAIGAKAGVNFSDVAVRGLDIVTQFADPQMIAGVNAGVFAEMPIGSGFLFSPEVSYTQKGFRLRESTTVNVFGLPVPLGAEAVTRLDYLDATLGLKFAIGNEKVRAYVMAGPVLGYAMSGTVTTRIKSIIDIKVAEIPLNTQGTMYNAWEIGAMAGMGVEFMTNSGKFSLDAGFRHGFTDVFDVPVVDVRVNNRALYVGAGYAFRF